jgi:hypothetical protein
MMVDSLLYKTEVQKAKNAMAATKSILLYVNELERRMGVKETTLAELEQA